jgi:hypothetical protein
MCVIIVPKAILPAALAEQKHVHELLPQSRELLKQMQAD